MTTSQSLLIEPDETAESIATSMCDVAKSLADDVRFERSVKLSPGSISWNRFLLSIDGAQTNKAEVLEAATQLGMPDALKHQLEQRHRKPSAVLLGFEQDGGHVVRKLYLEFWNDIVEQVQGEGNKKAPVLLNLGFKWSEQSSVITEYTCYPLLPAADASARIETIVDPISPGLCDVARGMVQLAARRARGSPLPYMEAHEEAVRASFDINVYQADLELEDVEAGIAAAATTLEIELSLLQPFTRYRFCPLGHLSGGIGRNRAPFLTLYFEDRSLRAI